VRKIVVNRCYGGFSLSEEAVLLYAKKKGVTLDPEDAGRGFDRDDPTLVEVVKELGDKASGRFAQLAIVAIPDDVVWEIEEYDGLERVAEKHHTWP